MPFDRPATISKLGGETLTRIKDPQEQQVIREFLAQSSARTAQVSTLPKESYEESGLRVLLILISVAVFGQRRSRIIASGLGIFSSCCRILYADSSNANKRAFADYNSSGNLPKRLVGMKANRGAILLIAEPNRTITFDKTYKGMSVKLINATDFQISFDAEDNRCAWFSITSRLFRKHWIGMVTGSPSSICRTVGVEIATTK